MAFVALCRVNKSFHVLLKPLVLPWLKLQLGQVRHAAIEPLKNNSPCSGGWCRDPNWSFANYTGEYFPFTIAEDSVPRRSACGGGAIYRLEMRRKPGRQRSNEFQFPLPAIAQAYSHYTGLKIEVTCETPCRHLSGVVNCVEGDCCQYEKVFRYVDADGSPRLAPLEPLDRPPLWWQGRYSVEEVEKPGAGTVLEVRFLLYDISDSLPAAQECLVRNTRGSADKGTVWGGGGGGVGAEKKRRKKLLKSNKNFVQTLQYSLF